MKAVQLVRWQAEPELREVEVPEPGPGEVLVKVVATGLCHSDLHLMEWPEGTLPWRLPFTLGHETAGTVAALGSRTVGLTEGEPVLVYGPWGCGSCVPAPPEARTSASGATSWRAPGAGSATTAGSPSTCSSHRRGCSCRSASSIRSARRR